MKLSAIAIAGGKSSRMGQDKAAIMIDGVPLLWRTCAIALPCVTEIYIVTGRPDRCRTLLDPYLQGKEFAPRLHFVPEADPQGPLLGFAHGLAAANRSPHPPDWVLLLACDLPNLQTKPLQTWATRLPDLPTKAIAYLPKLASTPDPSCKVWEPLCGFYRSTCAASLAKFIAQGGRSLQRWLAQQDVAEIPNPAPHLLFNCNTPEDLLLARPVREA